MAIGTASEKYRHANFDEAVINNLLELQKTFISINRPKNAFLILDDCIGTVKFNSPIWDVLATTARQYNISIFITAQKWTKLPPVIRSNSEYILLFKGLDFATLKSVYEDYGTAIPKFDDFRAFIAKNTENYKVVMITNNTPSNAINNVFSVLKAPDKFTQKRPNCFEVSF